jgi:uncharacterized protein with FMN-binding domain
LRLAAEKGYNPVPEVLLKLEVLIMFRFLVTLLLMLSCGQRFLAAGEKAQNKPLPAGADKLRTRAQAVALVKKSAAHPGWVKSIKTKPPLTLRLDWIEAKKGWHPDYNLGAHMISRVYPHSAKWKYGVKLMALSVQYCQERNQIVDSKKSYDTLGRLYLGFIGDPARAAHWWLRGNGSPVRLAECYRRLGCMELTLKNLKMAGSDGTRTGEIIRGWAEAGELRKALMLAAKKSRTRNRDVALLAAGNACRFHGKYADARTNYQRVLSFTRGSRDLKKNRERAKDALKALEFFENLDMAKVASGTYKSSCKGYRGNVSVSVTVSGGKITDAKVTGHKEDWSGRSITYVPSAIVKMNGIKGVDVISRATLTSDAIINAAAAALKQGAGNLEKKKAVKK